MSYSQMPYVQSYAESPLFSGSQGLVSFENAVPSNNRVRSGFADTLSNVFAEADGLPSAVSATVFNMGALAAGYAACAAAESNHHSLYANSTYNPSYFSGFHQHVPHSSMWTTPACGTENSTSVSRSLIPSSNSYMDATNSAATTVASTAASYHPYNASSTWPTYPTAIGAASLDGATRRKNAARENSCTLKAWLNEHMTNPYPTKGEKIMLAIITKMTLTQVSTWFANARRRLKKENKMTWTPHNRSDHEEDIDSQDDDEPQLKKSDLSISKANSSSSIIFQTTDGKVNDLSGRSTSSSSSIGQTRLIHNGLEKCLMEDKSVDNCDLKSPRIWSLARTAETWTLQRKGSKTEVTEIRNRLSLPSPTLSRGLSIRSPSQDLPSLSPSLILPQHQLPFSSGNFPPQYYSCLSTTFDLECGSMSQL